MLIWEKGHTFTYNGLKYVELDLNSDDYSDDIFYYEVCDDCKGTPEFNIRKKGGFFNTLFNNYEQKAMYRIDNAAGVTIYSDIFVDGELFCAEEDKEKTAEFYKDNSNYDWYFGADCYDTSHLLTLSDEAKTVLLNLDELEEKQEITADTYSSIIMESSDKVISAYIYIVPFDGSWYWDSGEETAEQPEGSEIGIYGYRLPESIEKKISKMYP